MDNKIEDLNKFRAEIIKLYLSGWSITMIADEYDTYPSVISWLISSYGISTKKYVTSVKGYIK